MKPELPDFATHDGRRAWSFLAIVGGCVVFTVLIFISLWLLHNHPGFVFWLAVLAHAQVLVGMTALGWAMGRRVVFSGSRDGVSLDDSGAQP